MKLCGNSILYQNQLIDSGVMAVENFVAVVVVQVRVVPQLRGVANEVEVLEQETLHLQETQVQQAMG